MLLRSDAEWHVSLLMCALILLRPMVAEQPGTGQVTAGSLCRAFVVGFRVLSLTASAVRGIACGRGSRLPVLISLFRRSHIIVDVSEELYGVHVGGRVVTSRSMSHRIRMDFAEDPVATTSPVTRAVSASAPKLVTDHVVPRRLLVLLSDSVGEASPSQ